MDSDTQASDAPQGLSDVASEPPSRGGGQPPNDTDILRQPHVFPVRQSRMAALTRLSKGRMWYYPYGMNPQPRHGWDEPPHEGLVRLLASHVSGHQQFLDVLSELMPFYTRIPREHSGTAREPHWRNGWLPHLDAMALYAVLASRKPGRYVEVGSGNSTKFARRAIEDHALPTTVSSIDPCPRAEIDELCDLVVRRPLQECDLSLLTSLEAGDVLFIDSSHQVYMNSDVTVLFMDVLPKLQSGVILHFHDIWLPWDYPSEWRYWNFTEQYMLASLLLSGSCARVLFPGLFASCHAATSSRVLELQMAIDPEADKPRAGSFWLEVL